MVTTRDIVIKWSAYAVASLLLVFVHSLTLRQIPIWGVRAFIPPLLSAIIASQEDTRGAVLFGTGFGLLCDLVVASPLPCLYTLSFTLAALFSSLLAKSVLQPGFLCSLIVSLLTFAVTDALSMLALSFRGAEALPMLSLAIREMAVSCILLPVCHIVLHYVHRRFTYE